MPARTTLELINFKAYSYKMNIKNGLLPADSTARRIS